MLKDVKDDHFNSYVDTKLDISFSLVREYGERYGFENIPKPALMSKFFSEKNKKNHKDTNSQPGHVRHCMPMMDAMKLGVGIPLWTDVTVRYGVAMPVSNPGNFPDAKDACRSYHDQQWHGVDQISGTTIECDRIKHSHQKTEWEHRFDADMEHEVYSAYQREDKAYMMPKLISPWIISVPEGWSLLLVPPLNQYNMPLIPFSGVVDADRAIPNFNIPCAVVDKDFYGLIERGTIIATIIPIPRVNRHLKVSLENGEKTPDRQQYAYINETSYMNGYLKSYREKRR